MVSSEHHGEPPCYHLLHSSDSVLAGSVAKVQHICYSKQSIDKSLCQCYAVEVSLEIVNKPVNHSFCFAILDLHWESDNLYSPVFPFDHEEKDNQQDYMNGRRMPRICSWSLFDGIEVGDIDAISASTALKLDEGEEKGALEFLDGLSFASSHCEAVNIHDICFCIRKRLRKLQRPEKELDRSRNGRNSHANETLYSTRFLLLHLIKTLRRIKSIENAASSLQDFNSVRTCWRLLKDVLLPFGFLHEPNVSVARTSDHSTYSSELRTVCLHIHLEALVLVTVAATDIGRLFPQFSTSLLEDRVWLRKQGDMEAATLSRHMVEFAVENLVLFALAEHSKVQKNNWLHLFSCGPYSCECFYKSLLTTIGLLSPDLPSSSQLGELVSTVSKIAEAVNKDLFQAGEEIPRSDVVFITHYFPENELPEFCIWFLSHVADFLHGRNNSDSIPVSKAPTAEKVLTDRVINPILSRLDKKGNESECRYLIVSLQRIQAITSPQNLPLAALLEYFFRHINDSFTLLQSSVENLSVIQDNCFVWAKTWSNDDSESAEMWSLGSNSSSFERFAHLLVWAVRHGTDTWKRMKGRVLSKFHTKFFSILKDTGWSHVFNLVLILAGRTNDTTDFPALFCDVELESNWKTKQDCDRTALIWRGFFAVIVMCQHRKLEHGSLVRKVAAEFDAASKNLLKHRSDPSLWSHSWSVVLEYLSVLPGFLTGNSNSLSTLSVLINTGVTELFQVYVDETKQGKLLTLFSDLLDYYLKQFPNWSYALHESDGRHHQAFLNSIFLNVLQPVKRLLSTSKTMQYPDLAASICTKCTLFGCGPQAFGAVADSPTSLFQMFILSVDIPCSALAVYLSQALSEGQIMGMLKKDELTDSNVIKCWVRSVIELGQDNSNIKVLTSLVKRFPELSDFDLEHLEYSAVFPTFVKRCGENLNLQPDYSSRMAYQRRCQVYFGDLHKFVLNVIRQCTSADLMDSCIGNAGLVIRHCYTMLYNRSKANTTCRMVVETVLTACDNPLVANSLRSYLSLYFGALCQLDLKLDQQAREIVSAFVRQTFLRFSSSHFINQHPLQRAIETEQDPRPEGCAFAIQVICNSFMLHVALPQNAVLAVQFLLTLIPTILPSVLASCLDTVFSTSVDVYLKGSDRSRTEVQQLIVLSLNLQQTCQNLELKSAFAITVREKTQSSLQSHPANLLALLNLLADTTPELLYGITPLLKQISNGVSGSNTVYQTAKARESYGALLKKIELSRNRQF